MKNIVQNPSPGFCRRVLHFWQSYTRQRGRGLLKSPNETRIRGRRGVILLIPTLRGPKIYPTRGRSASLPFTWVGRLPTFPTSMNA